MKKRTKIMQKVISVLLCVAMLVTYLPSVMLSAEEVPAFSAEKESDVHTLHEWKDFFGKEATDGDGNLFSENAGGVWGDKSVFADDALFTTENEFKNHNITLTDENDLLVVLSAIASNKTIVGYSTIPTDTVLVLDLSNSMSNDSVREMVQATNEAIRRLKTLNYNNRVGVVLYSGEESSRGTYGLDSSATLLLPLDRYTGATVNNTETFVSYNNDRVSVTSGVKNSKNEAVSASKDADGATYIQAGMWKAWQAFEAVPKADTVITTGVQKGTARMPVIVLMSDGAPTLGTSSFNNVGNSNRGNGTSDSADSINAFYSQLTNAWVRAKVEEHYSSEALFYSLGLNVGNNDIAESVLDPANATTTIKGYWSSYLASTTNGATVNLKEPDVKYNWGREEIVIPGEEFSVKRDTLITSGEYVTEYFTATTSQSGNGLINAFEAIVDQIIIQSKYYPTLVSSGEHDLDGYITFTDELGEYMEVKEIKGLTVDGKFYKGNDLAQAVANGSFGAIDTATGDLSNLNDKGLAVVSAVQKRLNCTREQALTVLSYAVKTGQLSYTNDAVYSNYIGWFSDAQGNFLGFWDGNPDSTLSGAVYANKSYGFLGEVGSREEYNQTDMLYVSVQVRKHLVLGHETVLYKIPASLVPMVTYEVEFKGDDLATGTDFKMRVTGAEAPLRLIFEVGLDKAITPYNITEKVADTYKNADGTYTFYTNAWKNHVHTHTQVDTHDATTLLFHPSMENERYYYVSDTPVLNAQGQPVTADPRNGNGVYYHEETVFTTTSATLTAAAKKTVLIPISAETLAVSAKQNATDNTWYIPKGTPYRLVSMFTSAKASNPTQTLSYVFHPDYVLPTAENDYYIDACMGNNGTLTVEPAQGIRLSKTMEFAQVGTDEAFTFDIALENATLANEYPYTKYAADGRVSVGKAVVSNGVATVTLKADEVLYLTDLPVGVTYTVTERRHDDYVVKTSSGTTGTIAAYTLSHVSFQNTPRVSGDLIISKVVTHDVGEGFVATDKEFDIQVTLNGVANGTRYEVTGVPGVTEATVQNGTLNFKIKHGQTIVVHGIEDGVTYRVTESAYAGFTLGGTGLTGTIDTAENQEAHLINHYVPASVPSVNITLNGNKTIDGRNWQAGDAFTFRLQYFDGSNWANVGNPVTVAYNAQGDYTFDMSSALQGFVFDEVGDYEFRVVEDNVAADGMISDPYEKKFEVTVVDNALSGFLKIGKVTTTTANTAERGGTVVANTANGFTVTTNFINRYSVDGIAEVAVEVTKKIDNDTGVDVPLSGFTFDLYRVDGNNEVKVLTSDPTDAHGLTSIALVYDAASFKGQTITYRLKETVGSIEGMIYDLSVKEFTVEIYDDLQGGVAARINGQDVGKYEAVFTNLFQLAEASLTIDGQKQVTNNRPVNDGEFTFELYECADVSFANPVLKDTVNNVGGTFAFDLTYDKAGYYYYRIKEADSGIDSIEDDATVYTVVVHVAQGAGASLQATVSAVTKNGERINEEIVFVNRYTSSDATYILSGVKVLEGRPLKEGEFTFLLYQADAQFNAQGEPRKATNTADGLFTFEALSFETAGTYYYVVQEDASAPKGGVTYDETAYWVTVEVKDNWDGTKTATATGATKDGAVNAVVFRNSYAPAETAVRIVANKVLQGADLAEGAFTFRLFEIDGANGEKTERATVKNDADGVVDFGVIKLHEAGVYTFEVVEDSSAQAEGITYDDTVYSVTMTVTDDLNGQLVAEVSYVADQNTVDDITFTNLHTPPATEQNPETGYTGLAWWMLAMLMGGLGLLLVKRNKKRA